MGNLEQMSKAIQEKMLRNGDGPLPKNRKMKTRNSLCENEGMFQAVMLLLDVRSTSAESRCMSCEAVSLYLVPSSFGGCTASGHSVFTDSVNGLKQA